jgi:glycosyltransferase involved in cell wall biosynthesis|tara:strand:- start:4545 stop:5516 length:972 start_codon:yes stop_codon:yes gene_type:complete
VFKTLNILDSTNTGRKEKLNILTFNTHERYQTQLSKTGHDFYCFNFDQGKEWFSEHAPMPENHYQLPKNSVYPGIVFDLILVQSKFGQFQTASNINSKLQLPVVVLEHTLPHKNWPQNHTDQFRSMVGEKNVFITEYSKGKWGIPGDVIYHSVDTNVFKPASGESKAQVLTVAHDFINRDYALNFKGWDRITQGLNRVVVGETEGLSKAAESVDELVKAYQQSLVYINPSTLSPVPTSMLEAMACGCAVVTTETCEIPNFIKHGENGFMSNDETELRGYIEKLLADPELAIHIGNNARQTIKEKFSEERFINEWNKIFYGVVK